MKTLCYTLVLFLSFYSTFLLGQVPQDDISKEYKKEVVIQLAQMISEMYVDVDVAKETSDYLLKQLEVGYFDQYKSNESFAEVLTTTVQEINHDKHMRIMNQPPYEAPKMTPERMIEEKLYNMDRAKNYNAGFNNVKVLEGNVGYFDLRGFTYFHQGKEVIDASMQLIKNSDAIIVDLSKNGGGDPETVKYLCSYFFKGGIHLNSLYFREKDGERTIDFHTLEDVEGKKMIDVPLFVITGSKTFSGAEEFSYNMQTQKRATLIGEITGGGANPGGTRPINDFLSVFIPTGKAINPITLTNWEGVGVIPEIKVEGDKAFERTYELAKEAAEKYRIKIKKEYTELLGDLYESLSVYNKDKSEGDIINAVKICVDKGLLQEWEINSLGYQYLMEFKKTEIAICLFKANTILNPDSYNAFDSYAEGLMADGQKNESIENYRKAVRLAKENNADNLEMYQENLQKALQQK